MSVKWVDHPKVPLTKDGARLLAAQGALMRKERLQVEELLDGIDAGVTPSAEAIERAKRIFTDYMPAQEWHDDDPLSGAKMLVSAFISAVFCTLVIIGAAAVIWVVANGGVR